METPTSDAMQWRTGGGTPRGEGMSTADRRSPLPGGFSYFHRERERDRHTDRETERDRDIQTDRQKQREMYVMEIGTVLSLSI